MKNKKKKKFNIDEFIIKTKKEKKKYILSQSEKINNPKNLDKKLYNSYKYKEVLNKFIVNYIEKIKENNTDEVEKKITNKINTIAPMKIIIHPTTIPIRD